MTQTTLENGLYRVTKRGEHYWTKYGSDKRIDFTGELGVWWCAGDVVLVSDPPQDDGGEDVYDCKHYALTTHFASGGRSLFQREPAWSSKILERIETWPQQNL